MDWKRDKEIYPKDMCYFPSVFFQLFCRKAQEKQKMLKEKQGFSNGQCLKERKQAVCMFKFYISSAVYFTSLLGLMLALNVLFLARKWKMNGEVANFAEDTTLFQQLKWGRL